MARVNLNAVYGPRGAIRSRKAPARNKPCPCGSGKKFKKCCGGRKHA